MDAEPHRPIVFAKSGFIGDFAKMVGDFIPNILDIGFGVGTTVWIYYLIKIPWGLYFKARKGRIDGQESKEHGIEQDEDSVRKLYYLERRLLVASLSAHVVSALGVWGISYLTGGKWIRPHAALLFLGSAILRPAWEFHFHIRARIEQLIRRIQYPKAYVEKLLADVATLEIKENQNEQGLKSIREQHDNDINDVRAKEDRDVRDLSVGLTADLRRASDKEQKDINNLQDQIVVLQKKNSGDRVKCEEDERKDLTLF